MTFANSEKEEEAAETQRLAILEAERIKKQKDEELNAEFQRLKKLADDQSAAASKKQQEAALKLEQEAAIKQQQEEAARKQKQQQ